MAEEDKIITDLPQKSSVTDNCNFPTDDSIQSYRVTALQIARYVQDMIMPPGTICWWPSDSVPTDVFLLMNGAAYDITQYPRLHAVIGSTYNTCINVTTKTPYADPGPGKFRVPDARGLFFRNVGQMLGYPAITLGAIYDDLTAVNGLDQNNIPTANHTHNMAHVHLVRELKRVSGTYYQYLAMKGKDYQIMDVLFGEYGVVGEKQPNGASGGSNAFVRDVRTLDADNDTQKEYTGGVTGNRNSGSGAGAQTGTASASYKLSGDTETRPASIGFHAVIKV